MPEEALASLKRTDLPIGTVVHHRGWIWSKDSDDPEHTAGWGRIIERKPGGNSMEYQIELSDPNQLGGGASEHWWASYHIDEWRTTP